MKPWFFLIPLIAPVFAGGLVPVDLRTEYHANPLALGTPLPRFSWQLDPVDPAARDLTQSAYDIEVSATDPPAAG